MFRVFRAGRSRLVAAVVAAVGGSVLFISGCSTEHQSTGNSPQEATQNPAGAPSQQESSQAPTLPKDGVVAPKDDSYGELIGGDEREWISADDKTWVRLSDEPGKHMTEARTAFEQNDRSKAAAELQRAAAQMVLEAARARSQVGEGLRGAAQQLDQLAQGVRDGKVASIQELDDAVARAASVLAKHYSERAYVALQENRPQHAGHFLKSAAGYLRKLKWDVEYFQDAQVPQAMEDLGRDTLLISGKLIEGAGYTADEASKAIEKVTAAVEKFGENVASQGSEAIPQAARKPLKAVCVLHPIADSGVSGTATFIDRRGAVDITAQLTGLKPGPHGFHIHQYGDCSALDGASAGGHYNPTAMSHGGPDSPQRHVGDLGNIVADESGKAEYKRTDHVIQLRGDNSIIGRAIIVHAGPDDPTSQPSGNAGARVACGVIGLANPAD